MPETPALQRVRQEDSEFKASLEYIRPCLEKQNETKKPYKQTTIDTDRGRLGIGFAHFKCKRSFQFTFLRNASNNIRYDNLYYSIQRKIIAASPHTPHTPPCYSVLYNPVNLGLRHAALSLVAPTRKT